MAEEIQNCTETITKRQNIRDKRPRDVLKEKRTERQGSETDK